MSHRLTGLQALRGVACLMVVLYHLGQWEDTLGLGKRPMRPFRWFGYAGVDLFFVLSGFVISAAATKHFGRPRELPRFLVRRAWRVYPPYWFAWFLGLAVTTQVYGHTVGHLDWANSLPGWLTLAPLSGTPPNLFVPQAWTLSYELTFYAAFGLLFLLPRRAAWFIPAGWAVAIVAGGWWGSTAFLLSPYILEFLAGVGLAFAIGRGRSVPWRGAFVIAVLWAVGASLWTNTRDPEWLNQSPWPRVLVFGPAAALIVAAVVALDRAGRDWSPRWLRAVGDASYSIYLIHFPVGYAMLLWTTHWPHRTLSHLAWCGLMIAACVGAGLAMHHLVERPLMTGRRPRWRLPSLLLAAVRRRVGPRPPLAGAG